MLLANVQAGESSILVWDDSNNVVIVVIVVIVAFLNSRDLLIILIHAYLWRALVKYEMSNIIPYTGERHHLCAREP